MKKKILFIFIFILFFLFALIITSKASYITYDGVVYNELPPIPDEVLNYEYYVIIPYYNYDKKDQSQDPLRNSVILLYSHNPFYYYREGSAGRNILFSSYICDLKPCYYYNNETDGWETTTSGLWWNTPTQAHYYYFDRRDNPGIVFYTNSDIYLNNNKDMLAYPKSDSYNSSFIDYEEKNGGFLFFTKWVEVESSSSDSDYLVWTGSTKYTEYDFDATSGENDNWTYLETEYKEENNKNYLRYTYFTFKPRRIFFCLN